jgi:hypothetical protein
VVCGGQRKERRRATGKLEQTGAHALSLAARPADGEVTIRPAR